MFTKCGSMNVATTFFPYQLENSNTTSLTKYLQMKFKNIFPSDKCFKFRRKLYVVLGCMYLYTIQYDHQLATVCVDYCHRCPLTLPIPAYTVLLSSTWFWPPWGPCFMWIVGFLWAPFCGLHSIVFVAQWFYFCCSMIIRKMYHMS